MVVVHGLDPATLSAAGQAAKSDLAPTLPLAATSPALCGTLTAGQMKMAGGADTGVSQETGTDTGALAVGGGLALVALAGGAYVVRRRTAGAAA
ncbi:LPXTG cell wall anchor domain-containing protein [Pseudarthrobacter sp. So.54]